MKVMVTGSRGYCGLAIVKTLLERGYQVVGFDKSPIIEVPHSENHWEIEGNIIDLSALFRALKGCQAVVHAVIHRPEETPFAAQITIPQERPFDLTSTSTYQVNVTGTFNVLELSRQSGIHQIILMSSARVVWDHFVAPDGNLRDTNLIAGTNTPLNFSDIYGLSKQLQEEIGKAYAQDYDFSVIVFRPWWVVDGITYRNRFGQPLSEDTVPLSPSGMVCRYDLSEACHLALERPDISFDIFYPVAGPDSERYFDVQHLKKTLNWSPRYTFSDLKRNS